MAQFQPVLEKVLSQYEGYFDVERLYTYGSRVVPAYAHFAQRMEKYLLIKKAQLHASETYEHVFFIHARLLNEVTWEGEKQFICNAERDYVVPHSDHLYSCITLVLLCDRISPSVKSMVKSLRYVKNYKLGFHGCSIVRVAALDLSDETIVTNRAGKDIKTVLERALREPASPESAAHVGKPFIAGIFSI